jgi:hypothetical protein
MRLTSRRTLIALALGVAAIAALEWGARRWRLRRLATFTPLVETFLDRAIAADSLGLLARSSDPGVVKRILRVRRTSPDDIALVRGTMRLTGGVWEEGRALLVYDTEASFCPARLGRRGEFHVQLVRVGAAWLVDHAAPPPC